MKRFGGTQIYRWWYHRCPYQVYLWYSGNVTEAKPTALQSLFFERGNELETRYLDIAKSHASSIVDIGRVARPNRAQATYDAICSGADLIIHPYFEAERLDSCSLDLRFVGEADLLVRDGDGEASYAMLEIKSSRLPKSHHIAQLAYYAQLFDVTVGRPPTKTQVVTWAEGESSSPDPVVTNVDITSTVADISDFICTQLPEHATDAHADFHVNTSCSSCPNRKHCHERARVEEHLSYLPGIRRKTRAALQMAGITRWPELAAGRSQFEKLKAGCPLTAPGMEQLRQQAISLRASQQINRARLNEHLGMPGRNSLGETAPPPGSPEFVGARVYLDLETDPVAGSATYLFGYAVEQVRQTGSPLALVWDRDASGDSLMNNIEAHCSKWGALQAPVQRISEPSNEAALFEHFLDEMDALRESYGRISVFHYGQFEANQLRRLARTHEAIPNVAARVARILQESVDLLSVTKATRILPVTSYSLKYVAPCLEAITSGEHGHQWDGPATMKELAAFLEARDIGERADQCVRAVAAAARRHRIDIEEVIAPTAGGSVLWYREHLAQPGEPVWPLLLHVYNHDDILAARAVTHWLIDEYRHEEKEGCLLRGSRQ